MTNNYLIKIALTRLVKELAFGRIKTPLTTLVNKGGLRPPSIYAAGMKGRNERLAKEVNARVYKTKDKILTAFTQERGGAFISPQSEGKHKILITGKDIYEKNKDPIRIQASIQHELYEAAEAQRAMHMPELVLPKPKKDFFSRLVDNGIDPLIANKLDRNFNNQIPLIGTEISNRAGQTVGKHLNLRVLSRESEMLRKNPYLSKLREDRNFTGEDKLIERVTGKRYGMDKMTGKDHHKALSATPHHVVQVSNGESNHFAGPAFETPSRRVILQKPVD